MRVHSLSRIHSQNSTIGLLHYQNPKLDQLIGTIGLWDGSTTVGVVKRLLNM